MSVVEHIPDQSRRWGPRRFLLGSVLAHLAELDAKLETLNTRVIAGVDSVPEHVDHSVGPVVDRIDGLERLIVGMEAGMATLGTELSGAQQVARMEAWVAQLQSAVQTIVDCGLQRIEARVGESGATLSGRVAALEAALAESEARQASLIAEVSGAVSQSRSVGALVRLEEGLAGLLTKIVQVDEQLAALPAIREQLTEAEARAASFAAELSGALSQNRLESAGVRLEEQLTGLKPRLAQIDSELSALPAIQAQLTEADAREASFMAEISGILGDGLATAMSERQSALGDLIDGAMSRVASNDSVSRLEQTIAAFYARLVNIEALASTGRSALEALPTTMAPVLEQSGLKDLLIEQEQRFLTLSTRVESIDEQICGLGGRIASFTAEVSGSLTGARLEAAMIGIGERIAHLEESVPATVSKVLHDTEQTVAERLASAEERLQVAAERQDLLLQNLVNATNGSLAGLTTTIDSTIRDDRHALDQRLSEFEARVDEAIAEIVTSNAGQQAPLGPLVEAIATERKALDDGLSALQKRLDEAIAEIGSAVATQTADVPALVLDAITVDREELTQRLLTLESLLATTREQVASALETSLAELSARVSAIEPQSSAVAGSIEKLTVGMAELSGAVQATRAALEAEPAHHPSAPLISEINSKTVALEETLTGLVAQTSQDFAEIKKSSETLSAELASMKQQLSEQARSGSDPDTSQMERRISSALASFGATLEAINANADQRDSEIATLLDRIAEALQQG